MGEVTEKIYCCDKGDNDNALTASILAGNNKNIDNLIAITEKEHNKYIELVEANMDKELTKIRDNNG